MLEDNSSNNTNNEITKVRAASQDLFECTNLKDETCLGYTSYVWTSNNEGLAITTLIANGTKIQYQSDFYATDSMICIDTETSKYFWEDNLLKESAQPIVEALQRLSSKFGRFFCDSYSQVDNLSFSTYSTAGVDMETQRPLPDPIGSADFVERDKLKLRDAAQE